MDIDSIVQSIQLLPKFSKVDPALIRLEVQDAISTLDVSKLPASVRPTAIRYYACHMLLMQSQADRGVVSETMGTLSHSFIQYSGSYDQYLKALDDLLDRYGANRSRGAVWTVD